MIWSPTTNEIVFTAASLIVAMEAPDASPSVHSTTGVTGLSLEDDTAGGWASDTFGAARGATRSSTARRQRLFAGHTSYVTCLALGAEGKLLASGQEGKQAIVRLWDFESGECLAILCGEWGLTRGARSII